MTLPTECFPKSTSPSIYCICFLFPPICITFVLQARLREISEKAVRVRRRFGLSLQLTREQERQFYLEKLESIERTCLLAGTFMCGSRVCLILQV